MRYPEDVPVLTDGHVTLRAHRLDDVDAITEQCTDVEMQRFTMVPVPYTRQDAVDFVASRAGGWADGTSCSFAIEAAEESGPARFAGSIALRSQGADELADLAFGAHPAARGHGVMTVAVRVLADWAFQERQVKRLNWSCIAGNLASWRVVWRNGFHFEATLHSAQPQRGELLDRWTGSLLSSQPREPQTRWLPQPVLFGDRVVLRPLDARDERRYLETVLDAETHRWLHEIPFPRDPDTFEMRVRDRGLWASLGQFVEYAVADAVTDDYVGSVAIFGFGGLDYESAEIGYRTHPDARGRGFMTTSIRLLLGLAFAADADGGYGLHRVNLGAGDGNTASQAVARACGFTETGRDRSCYRLADDTVVDLVRFDLLADEWRSRSLASQDPERSREPDDDEMRDHAEER